MTTYIIGHQKPDTDAVVSALAYEYLAKQLDWLGHQNPQAVITDPLNPETSYLFDKLHLETPRLIRADDLNQNDEVVLVDHNEENQRLPNLDQNKIVKIIDHHKVNLNFNRPIFLNFKPWGSTATIIYFLMKTFEIKPDQTLATLMLAAILSDTVGFKSATTTEKDQELAKELASIANINDLNAFTLEIFKAKSDLSELDDYQVATNDYKIFDFGGKKVFVNQVETVEQAEIIANRKPALIEALAKVKQEMKVDLAFLAVSDILNVNTKIIVAGKEEAQVAEKAFGEQVINQVIDIGPKLSRKKEIAPALEKVIS